MDTNITYTESQENDKPIFHPVDIKIAPVIGLSVLCVIGGLANVTILCFLCKRKAYKDGLKPLILNLCMADLISAIILLPVSIGWEITIAWKAGDTGCRVLKVLMMFILYLSSFIHIAIAVDRCIADKFNNATKRIVFLLLSAWILAFVCSLPQAAIWRAVTHPQHDYFVQCVTFDSFPSETHKTIYNVFTMICSYILPICIILATYPITFYKVFRRSYEHVSVSDVENEESNLAHGSSMSHFKNIWNSMLTFAIMVIFIVTHTPYYVIHMWYTFNSRSAYMYVNANTIFWMYILMLSNASLNPITYGIFEYGMKQYWIRVWYRYTGRSRGSDEMLHARENDQENMVHLHTI